MRDADTLAELGDLLTRVGANAHVRALAEAAILIHEHPHWAVWIPRDQAGWTAVRPASSRRRPELWPSAATWMDYGP